MCQKMANHNQVSNFNVRMDYSVTALHVCVGGGGGVVSMPVTVWFPSIPVHVQSSKQLIKRYWLWPHPFFTIPMSQSCIMCGILLKDPFLWLHVSLVWYRSVLFVLACSDWLKSFYWV